jgi:cytochrome c556
MEIIMTKKSSFIVAIFIALTMSLGGVLAADKEPTLEEKAHKFRDGLFHVIYWQFERMIEAKFAGDKATFHKNAAEISYLSKMITEGFIPNSIVKGSKAKKEIWEDWDKFTEKAADFTKNADELANPSYDIAEFDPRKFGGENCGGCHRKFKVKDE